MRIKTETSVGLFILVAIGIFLYMSFQIGVIRFDTAKYNRYTVYFKDVSGLNKKADVQISGVKVGWVDKVELVNNGQQVKADVMILNSYILHSDAYGIVRQDGLLGTKYVELSTGDPHMPTLGPDGILMKASKDPVSIDQLLIQIQTIAKNIEEVSLSVKEALGGESGVKRLEGAIDNFSQAAGRISSVVKSLGTIIDRNDKSFDDIVRDMRSFIGDLKSDLPRFQSDIRDSIERASKAIDRDLDKLTVQFEKTTGPLSEAAQKISDGEGVIGKLLSDEEMGHSIKTVVNDFRKYFNKIDKTRWCIDVHGEAMAGIGNHLNFSDAKGYANLIIQPSEDYFYLGGLVGAYSGSIKRYKEYREWFKQENELLCPDAMHLDDADQLKYAPIRDVQLRVFDHWLFNLQLGKLYDWICLRGGLIESTLGVGVDVNIPLENENLKWVTSLEAFDFKGRYHIDDNRLHLKWINRLVFGDSAYLIFGADDFASRTNKNAIFGLGINVCQ